MLTAWTYLNSEQQAQYTRLVRTYKQRKGQAWFNVLDSADRQMLAGTPFDPSYSDSAEVILRALAFLTEQRASEEVV